MSEENVVHRDPCHSCGLFGDYNRHKQCPVCGQPGYLFGIALPNPTAAQRYPVDTRTHRMKIDECIAFLTEGSSGYSAEQLTAKVLEILK